MITLTKVSYIQEADMICMKLEEAGIKAFIADQGIAQVNALYSNAIGGIRIQINENDLEQAKEILFEVESVDAGIFQMVDELLRAGASRQSLVAKVAGGANMFESTYQTLVNSIGARNAKSARVTLAELGIPLHGEDVGGNRGRTICQKPPSQN